MSKMLIAADANFLLVEVASAQGKTEKDAALRKKYFGAAVGALGKVRGYWKGRPQWEQDRLDILSGDVVVRRMEAELAMGLKDEAKETCGAAASKFQVFIQAHGPSEAVPFDKMEVGAQNNLEEAYAKLLPLMVELIKVQKDAADRKAQADKVVELAEEYEKLFPNGKSRMVVVNMKNQAMADGGSSRPGDAAPADTAPAAAEGSEEPEPVANAAAVETEESKGE